jgi:hypothetical protein
MFDPKSTDQLRTICCHWNILDPVMGSRPVAEPLYTRSSMSAAKNAQEDAPHHELSNPPSGWDLSSGHNMNDIKDESQTPTPASASQKKKNKKKKSSLTSCKGKSTQVAKSKAKKNPKDFS